MQADAIEVPAISVLIIGCGPAGLINARTLIRDGFKVTIVCKEDGVGGCWRTTYPDLTTNSPWGSFTYSGLDMAKPSHLNGSFVPARTYTRYLEDFYHHFVEGKVEVLFKTEVTLLSPSKTSDRGWSVVLTSEGQEKERDFGRVVLALGSLGLPYIPGLFQASPIPAFHTSTLATRRQFDEMLAQIPETASDPTPDGDGQTVLVVGGGKSSMDMAALLANRGRKVVWACRGPLKWFAPAVPAGMFGANRLDILLGPSRHIDSWTMWFYHCTWIGARLFRQFWKFLKTGWLSCYPDNVPKPVTDPFVDLANFAGSLTLGSTDFVPLVRSGRIAVVGNVKPTSIDKEGVNFDTSDGQVRVRCASIIVATGYLGHTHDFIESKTRKSLGLHRQPPPPDYKEAVLKMRKKWRTVEAKDVEKVDLPLVFRGILPFGRFKQRDLAITGGTKPLAIPAITYEVESHWISSLFRDDPFLHLPKDEKYCLKEIHADNTFFRARYPGVDPYRATPSLTYFAGFNDLAASRQLLRDMSLDPWRQKSNGPWWKFWGNSWMGVRANAEQYATLGEERKKLREMMGTH